MVYLLPSEKFKKNNKITVDEDQKNSEDRKKKDKQEFVLCNQDNPHNAKYLVGVNDGDDPQCWLTSDTPTESGTDTDFFLWRIEKFTLNGIACIA